MIADSEQHFEWYAVSTRVNNARNEGPELMAKLSAATLFD
jgi:putative SOS response-associated peptidase YedK